MANSSKDQGTKYETEIVRMFQDAGLHAQRIAEGGANDIGDVYCEDYDLVIEAKDRASLNIHEAVVKAQMKAGGRVVALFWKRRVRVNGNRNRTQPGPPVVVMSQESFLELVGLAVNQQGQSLK